MGRGKQAGSEGLDTGTYKDLLVPAGALASSVAGAGRGVLSQSLGLPGDLEGLGREGLNWLGKNYSDEFTPYGELLPSKKTNILSDDTFLPKTEEYRDKILPQIGEDTYAKLGSYSPVAPGVYLNAIKQSAKGVKAANKGIKALKIKPESFDKTKTPSDTVDESRRKFIKNTGILAASAALPAAVKGLHGLEEARGIKALEEVAPVARNAAHLRNLALLRSAREAWKAKIAKIADDFHSSEEGNHGMYDDQTALETRLNAIAQKQNLIPDAQKQLLENGYENPIQTIYNKHKDALDALESQGEKELRVKQKELEELGKDSRYIFGISPEINEKKYKIFYDELKSMFGDDIPKEYMRDVDKYIDLTEELQWFNIANNEFGIHETMHPRHPDYSKNSITSMLLNDQDHINFGFEDKYKSGGIVNDPMSPQLAQTPRGRAIAAQNQNIGPAVQNGIAMIGGVPYVLSNTGAIGADQGDINRYAQEFQTRAGSNLSGQARSTALGVPSLGAPRTGQWVPVNSLTPEFYTRNYEQNWKNTPGYTPVLTPELQAAIASKDPNKIAIAHYNALHTLPKKGQDFGSFLADFAPQIALGAIPGIGPALAATYGGVRTAVNGGSPLEIILNTAGSWGGGQLIPGIQAAGGIQNFINQGISKATGIFSNPSSAFSSATSGAASNPFKTAVDIAGNIPTSLVKKNQPAAPVASAPAPRTPSSVPVSSPNFVGPRPITPTQTPPVRRADGGPIGADAMHPMGRNEAAMNPMGAPPVSAYGLASLATGGGPGEKPIEGYLDGAGDGMSDSIPATIDGKQPARLADGEFVIPADVVSGLGNGSSKAGAKLLYAMMDRVRHARTGNPKQGKEIDAEKYLPA